MVFAHIQLLYDIRLYVHIRLIVFCEDGEWRLQNGWTPLHSSASGGHAEVVSMLLSAGAVVEASTLFGQTPLVLAVTKGHSQAARVLLEAGADVHARGKVWKRHSNLLADLTQPFI